MVFKKHTTEIKFLALRALDNGKDIDDVVRDFDVSKRSILRWQDKLEQHKTLARFPGVAGRPRLLSAPILEELAFLLGEAPSMYLAEITDYLTVMHSQTISTSALAKNLQDIGYHRKVQRKIAAQRDEGLRIRWMDYMLRSCQADQYVFVDESSKDGRTIARRYGRAPKGQTPEEIVTYDRGQRYSILPALSLDGYIALRVVEGSVDGEEYFDFILNDVLPLMNAWPENRSVLVMDNCNIHKSHAVRTACEEKGVLLIYLPPYSPDFNPIEESFSAVKAYLRRYWREFEESGDPELDLYAACLAAVNAHKAVGWFAHSGYI